MKLLIFTYAPTGLGHLRVTDALVDERPKDSAYVLLGSMDRFMTWIHRFMSLNPFGKYIFLRSQYGKFEDIFTNTYRKFLVLTAGSIYRQLLDLIVRNKQADEVLILATHFAMAHQIGAIKDRLKKETGKEIRLIVQVTDDTSQHIWCVKGADLTFVPSLFVKNKFEYYARTKGISFVSEVIPYPLSPTLTAKLSGEERHEAFEDKTKKINVAIPISGAAVGLTFFTLLIAELTKLSDRFEFWIIVKKSPFTDMFITVVKKMKGVHVMAGKNDIQMIELYELLYEQHLIHIEITKPSEQAFKGILSPSTVGGSILLFTSPIGRQEKDNIRFLERHGLLPKKGVRITPRAIRISVNPKIAARFIVWGEASGLFAKMCSAGFAFNKHSLESGEIGVNGARLFWKKVLERFPK